MKSKLVLSILIFIVMVSSAACLSSTPKTAAAPALDLPATQAAEKAAVETRQAAEAALAAETRAAVDATEKAAAEKKAAATEQAEKMNSLVQQLYAEKLISSPQGIYIKLDDFNESWAQIDWYQWYNTGLSPENFVLNLDIAYESASKYANWQSSGCGFVFRETPGMKQNEFHFYRVFYALDGFVYFDGTDGFMTAWDGNVYPKDIYLAKNKFGPPVLPAGNVKMTIIAEGEWVTVLINGKKVIQKQDATFRSGKLSYTLASGTNKDFGTRCEMTNIEMWELP